MALRRLFEQVLTVDGGTQHRELTPHQTKRDTTRHKDGPPATSSTLATPWPAGHPDHDWWEPLLNTAEDTRAKFNRTEYLRNTPTTSTDTGAFTGCGKTPRASTPSSRGPSTANDSPHGACTTQTAVVLLAAIAENAWARHVWQTEARHQALEPAESSRS